MCINPFSLKYVDFLGRDRSISVGCGKCIECIKRTQNDWKIRLIEEFKDWDYCYFFTLTYRDKSLPMVKAHDTGEMLSTGRKSDIQDWIKRFRTNYVRQQAMIHGTTIRNITSEAHRLYSCKIKYFFCLEYGPNGTNRPHYHGIIFSNLPKNQLAPLIVDWRKRFGFVRYSRVRKFNGKNPDNPLSAPANYVSKYCCKGQFCSRKDDIDNFRISREFRLMSKNIGLSYVSKTKDYHLPKKSLNESTEQYLERIFSRLRYNDNGFSYSLPRYYKSHIFYTKVREVRSVYSPKDKKFVARQVSRLAPHTFLCCKMQDYLQRQYDMRFKERYEIIRNSNSSLTDSEICSAIASIERDIAHNRARVLNTKIGGFYYQNKLKNKQL